MSDHEWIYFIYRPRIGYQGQPVEATPGAGFPRRLGFRTRPECSGHLPAAPRDFRGMDRWTLTGPLVATTWTFALDTPDTLARWGCRTVQNGAERCRAVRGLRGLAAAWR